MRDHARPDTNKPAAQPCDCGGTGVKDLPDGGAELCPKCFPEKGFMGGISGINHPAAG